MTLAQADEHQRRHGFPPLQQAVDETLEKINKLEKKLRGKARTMNQTEREFAAMLDEKKRRATIIDFRFEGVRLGWGDCMVYKPDFTVFANAWDKIRLIEVKGQHMWKHAIVRFKGCRAEWKDFFDFEFWQKDEHGQWHRLL